MAHKGWQPPFNRDRHEQSGQYRLWSLMRVHRVFTYQDLMAVVDRSLHTVKSYCLGLARAGYLRRSGKHDRPVYTLIRDTGPYAPQIRRDGRVFDLNTKRVMEVRRAD